MNKQGSAFVLAFCFGSWARLEESGADGQGGDGGGFGAEDARAEGDVVPAVIGEELHLVGGPAAFGTDG